MDWYPSPVEETREDKRMAGAQLWREHERESLCCWAKIAQEFLLDQMWSKQRTGQKPRSIPHKKKNLAGRMMGSSKQSVFEANCQKRRVESKEASCRKSLAVWSLKEPPRSPLTPAPEKETAVNSNWSRTLQS